MTIGLSESIRNARLDLITAALDAGTTAGLLQFFTGPRPATGAAITSQTLLGTVTFASPAAPAAASGVLTFSPITQDSSADADGTAVWARATDSAGNFVADFSVGGNGSGEDIELNITTIVTGGSISVTSGTITAGNA
ncbi:hypothetical protein A9404_00530 [Halothiobacillus diazotrophicus]|uniref:Uncharacterized protein n=1 Tax=Halothiobacillus diazotrophicus TaxID=1860122 RepID=A0A191ZDX0_9GAMM|nr:hypothetical protein [Halothiobacillus diazotrophicus]ANJ66065.1 hypothetical protein A9404_00530 [Halothiobacillus diazotrophicus]